MKLIFFDIDGTLLLSQGAGGRSISKTMRAAFGITGEIARIEIHGQTDRGIATQLFAAHAIEDSEENWDKFTDTYLPILQTELKNTDGYILPGIPNLLDELEDQEHCELALLTGNIEAGAKQKVSHFGIAEYFSWGGFGDRQRDRCDLAREAMERASKEIELERVEEIFVIGDTPNDIRCGKAIDATTIGVATATYTEEQLAEHSPDHVFADLSNVAEVMSVLVE